MVEPHSESQPSRQDFVIRFNEIPHPLRPEHQTAQAALDRVFQSTEGPKTVTFVGEIPGEVPEAFADIMQKLAELAHHEIVLDRISRATQGKIPFTSEAINPQLLFTTAYDQATRHGQIIIGQATESQNSSLHDHDVDEFVDVFGRIINSAQPSRLLTPQQR